MTRCKFWTIADRANVKTPEVFFDNAREGYFYKLGEQNGNTMAFIRDRTGVFVATYPDLVKLLETPMDRLLEKVLAEMEIRVPLSKREATRENIIHLFETYAW